MCATKFGEIEQTLVISAAEKNYSLFPQHVTSMIFVEEKCITWPIISAAQYCQHKIFYCYAESCCKITGFSFILDGTISL